MEYKCHIQRFQQLTDDDFMDCLLEVLVTSVGIDTSMTATYRDCN